MTARLDFFCRRRSTKLAEARAKIEAHGKERFEREAAEHRAKLAAREAKAAATGKKPGGKPPAPPVEGAQPKDQINLTDEVWQRAKQRCDMLFGLITFQWDISESRRPADRL